MYPVINEHHNNQKRRRGKKKRKETEMKSLQNFTYKGITALKTPTKFAVVLINKHIKNPPKKKFWEKKKIQNKTLTANRITQTKIVNILKYRLRHPYPRDGFKNKRDKRRKCIG